MLRMDDPTGSSKAMDNAATITNSSVTEMTDDLNGSQSVDNVLARANFADLYRYATWKEKAMVLLGVFASIGYCVCQPLAIFVVGRIINAYGTITVSDAEAICLNFVWIALAVIVCGTVQTFCLNTAAERISHRLQVNFFEAVLKKDASMFDLKDLPARMIVMSSAEIESVKSALGQKLGLAVQTFGQFLTCLIIGFTRTWQLSLVVLAFCPVIGLGGFIAGSQVAKEAKLSSQVFAAAASVTDEAFRSVRTVTTLSVQNAFISKLSTALVPVEKHSRYALLVMGFGMGLFTLAYQTSYSPSYYVGTLLVVNARELAFDRHPLRAPPPDPRCAVDSIIPMACSTQADQPNLTFATAADVCNCAICQCGCFYPSGQFDYNACLSPGDVIVTFFTVIIAGASIGMFLPHLQAIRIGQVAAGKLFGVIDEIPVSSTNSASGKQIDITEIKGEIQFDQAVFAYPTRPGIRAMDETTLTIEAGKRTAICGASGSGKSSLVATFMRFYDISSGRILLDGVDIREINIESLRSAIGLVSQEPTLFAGLTIRENVRFGLSSATDEEVEKACRLSGAHDFVMAFPDRYETVLVGSGLSGGQKQRLALARALIRHPRVLILDEATSALDTESERAVNNAIEDLGQERTNMTVVVIAHRLSTIRTCEKIIMLGGPGAKVLETGSHDELMVAKGPYYELVQSSEMTVANKIAKVDPNFVQITTAMPITNEASNDDDPVSRDNTPTSKEMDTRDVASATAETTKASEFEFSKRPGKVPLQRLIPFMYDERYLFVAAIIGAMVNGAANPWLAFVFARVVPSMFYMNNATVLSTASLYSWIFFGIGLAKGTSVFVSTWLFGVVSSAMTRRIRLATFSHILRFEMGYFDESEHNPGTLTQTLAKDAALVKGALNDMTNLLVATTTGLVTGIILAMVASWKLALVVLAMFPLVGLGIAINQLIMGGMTHAKASSNVQAAQVFSEAVHGYRTVCAFNLRGTLVSLYAADLAKQEPRSRKMALTNGLTYGFAQSVQFFSWAIMFYYGAVLLNNGEVDLQDILQVIVVMIFAAMGVGNSISLSPDFKKGKAAAKSIFAILDRQSKIDPLNENGMRPSAVLGDIIFQSVSFTYPSRKDCAVLRDVSFRVPRGTVTALVGESGSGKSTIVQLLERFYDPSSGRVLLDDRPLNELNLMWLRSRIGFVSQEPVLFDDTIFNNIQYGLGPDMTVDLSKEEITKRIETAARDANALEFILQLPDGFQTRCGVRGSQLSGGQKQRIAISRALVRDPDILICDEATSALDEESQRLVQDALDRLLDTRKRTVIIIAHRLSTVQRADMIVALRQGQIFETGTYAELAGREGGYFRSLLEQQGRGTSEMTDPPVLIK